MPFGTNLGPMSCYLVRIDVNFESVIYFLFIGFLFLQLFSNLRVARSNRKGSANSRRDNIRRSQPAGGSACEIASLSPSDIFKSKRDPTAADPPIAQVRPKSVQ